MKTQNLVNSKQNAATQKEKPQHLHLKDIAHLSPQDQDFFVKFGFGSNVKTQFSKIHHAIESQALAQPNAIAAEHLNETITYGELNEKATQVAKVLLQNGVQPGDNVGLFLSRSIPMLIGILAILKTGASYVPKDARVTPQKILKEIGTAANIEIILTIKAFENSTLTFPDKKQLVIEDIINHPQKYDLHNQPIRIPEIQEKPESNCFILFTSGTTGTPNGVQVTHRNVCNIILTKPGNLSIRPGIKVAQLLSISFDMSAWEILGCLSNGGTLIIRGKSIPETAKKAHIIIATPSVLSKISPETCLDIQKVAVAGEPCPIPLANLWATYCNFYNCCGPTETTIVNTMQLCKPNSTTISIGKPTPNNTIYVLDNNMKPLPIGEIGQMWGGGDCVTQGYLNNPKLNKERYAPDPFLNNGKMMFRTGDLGRWNTDGALEHYGRVDDQVKIRGFRVELDSVAMAIEGTPNCNKAVALKLDNRHLVAFASPKHIDTQKAKEQVLAQLPYYCEPKFIIPIEKLPMTPRGKVDKRQLLEMAKLHDKDIETTEATTKLQKEIETIILPPKKGFWTRLLASERFQHYHRIFALMVFANLALLAYGLTTGEWWQEDGIALQTLSYIVLANFSIGILVRQHHVVNLFFKIATSFPTSYPLYIRRFFGKVYHFGGFHTGGNVSGSVWMLLFIGSLFYHYTQNLPGVSNILISITSVLIVILVFMIIMALPKNRAKFHNNFELAHRFGGWTALLLFWAQSLVFINDQTPESSYMEAVVSSPAFWMLVILTISIALPWIRLRKVPIKITNPSSHVALVDFDYGVTPFTGSSTAISRNPLFEWHSFANVKAPNKEGFKLTISRAGDWTGQFIDDLPSHVWVKGILTAGVGNIDQLFKKVVWVATGSGIGPCLPHLLSQEVPSRLVWATRSPRKTYGDELVDEILEAQKDAIIWNTDTHGKPDMPKLTYKVFQEFDAEAVICISNKKLTWLVVSEMESRGIPAYGAIWDS